MSRKRVELIRKPKTLRMRVNLEVDVPAREFDRDEFNKRVTEMVARAFGDAAVFLTTEQVKE